MFGFIGPLYPQDAKKKQAINIRKNVLFLSTSQGILTHLECKQRKLGGILFFIC